MKTRSLLIITVLFSLCATALAQTKGRVLDKETFMDMESVSNPAISPDGKQIVFTRSWVDKVKDEYAEQSLDRRYRRLPRARTDLRRLATTVLPVWSPDGKRIAFLSDRDGTNQLHVMWVDTREVAQLTHLEQAPAGINWSPDGKQIAFTRFVADNDPILAVKLPERPRNAQWARPAVIVDRLAWAADGRGPAAAGLHPGLHHRLGAWGHAAPDHLRQIQSQRKSGGFDWSPTARRFMSRQFANRMPNTCAVTARFMSIDLKTLEVKPLTDRKGPDGNPQISPDGPWIAYTGYDDKKYTNHVSSLYLMDNAGGGKSVWADNLPSSPQGVRLGAGWFGRLLRR